MRESSIVLGSPNLGDEEWATLAGGAQVFALLINDHEGFHSVGTRRAGSDEIQWARHAIPEGPVLVPRDKLDSREFRSWVQDMFGVEGLLVLWDSTEAWWILEHDGLELTLVCAPNGMFSRESDSPDWLGTLGNATLQSLAQSYGIVDQDLS